MSEDTDKSTPEDAPGKERLGRCLVGGVGVSKDGTVTVVKPRELPDKPDNEQRKAD